MCFYPWEILVTLGIIGIVAALTLPSLITDYKDKVFAARAKKTYSLIAQAIAKYQADEGTVGDITGLFDTSKTSEEVLLNFSKYFQVTDICLDYSCPKYLYDIAYDSIKYDVNNEAVLGESSPPIMILKDGTLIWIKQYASCKHETSGVRYNPDGTTVVDDDGKPIIFTFKHEYCAEVAFDTNGSAGPNVFGADAFGLHILENGSFTTNTASGHKSLQSILQGGDPIYKIYHKGEKFEG